MDAAARAAQLQQGQKLLAKFAKKKKNKGIEPLDGVSSLIETSDLQRSTGHTLPPAPVAPPSAPELAEDSQAHMEVLPGPVPIEAAPSSQAPVLEQFDDGIDEARLHQARITAALAELDGQASSVQYSTLDPESEHNATMPLEPSFFNASALDVEPASYHHTSSNVSMEDSPSRAALVLQLQELREQNREQAALLAEKQDALNEQNIKAAQLSTQMSVQMQQIKLQLAMTEDEKQTATALASQLSSRVDGLEQELALFSEQQAVLHGDLEASAHREASLSRTCDQLRLELSEQAARHEVVPESQQQTSAVVQQQELAQLNSVLISTREQLEDSRRELEQTKNAHAIEVLALNRRIAETQNKSTAASRSLQDLQSETTRLRTELQETMQKHAMDAAQLEQLRVSKDEAAQQQQNQLQEVRSAYESELKAVHERLAAELASVAALRQELAGSAQQAQHTSPSTTSNQGEGHDEDSLLSLRGQVDQERAMLAHLQDLVSAKRIELDEANDQSQLVVELAQQREQNDQLQNELAQQQIEMQGLESLLAYSESVREVVEREKADAIRAFEEKLAAFTEELGSGELVDHSESEMLQDEIHRLQQERLQYVINTDRISTLETELTAATMKLQEYEQQKQAAMRDLADASKRAIDAESSEADLAHQLNTVSAHLEASIEARERLRNELEAESRQHSELAAILDMKGSAQSELQRKVETQRGTIAALKDQLESAQSSMKGLHEELAREKSRSAAESTEHAAAMQNLQVTHADDLSAHLGRTEELKLKHADELRDVYQRLEQETASAARASQNAQALTVELQSLTLTASSQRNALEALQGDASRLSDEKQQLQQAIEQQEVQFREEFNQLQQEYTAIFTGVEEQNNRLLDELAAGRKAIEDLLREKDSLLDELNESRAEANRISQLVTDALQPTKAMLLEEERKHNKTREDLSRLQSQFEASENERAVLRRKLEALEGEQSQAASKYASVLSDNEQLRNVLSHEQHKVMQLTEEVLQHKAAAQSTLDEQSSLADQLRASRHALQRTEQQLEQKSIECNDIRARAKEIQESVQQLKEQHARAENANAKRQEDMARLQSVSQARAEKEAQLQTTIDNLQQELSVSRETSLNYTNATEEQHRLQREISTLSQRLVDQRTAFEAQLASTKKDALEFEMRTTADLRESTALLASVTEERDRLQLRLMAQPSPSSQDQSRQLRDANELLTAQLSEKVEAEAAAVARESALVLELEQVKQQLQDLHNARIDTEQLTMEVVRQQSTIAQLGRELKNERFKAAQVAQTQTAMFASFQSKSAQFQSQVTSLEAELQRSLVQQKELAERLINAKDQLAALATQKSTKETADTAHLLERRMSDLEQVKRHLATENDALSAEVMQLKAQLAENEGGSVREQRLHALCRSQEDKILALLEQQAGDAEALTRKETTVKSLEARLRQVEEQAHTALNQSQTASLQATLKEAEQKMKLMYDKYVAVVQRCIGLEQQYRALLESSSPSAVHRELQRQPAPVESSPSRLRSTPQRPGHTEGVVHLTPPRRVKQDSGIADVSVLSHPRAGSSSALPDPSVVLDMLRRKRRAAP